MDAEQQQRYSSFLSAFAEAPTEDELAVVTAYRDVPKDPTFSVWLGERFEQWATEASRSDETSPVRGLLWALGRRLEAAAREDLAPAAARQAAEGVLRLLP